MYIDIILPVPLSSQFTYLLPTEMEGKACVGSRVVAPFGKNKLYTGVITRIHNDTPKNDFLIKSIVDILDEIPSVSRQQLELWEWISNYYMCTPGDVLKASLPSGMKLESETKLTLNNGFSEWENLTKKEYALYELLQEKHFGSVSQLQKAAKSKNVFPLIRNLMNKGAVLIQEELRNKYTPKTETHIRLAEKYRNPNSIAEIKELICKQAKRSQLFHCYLEKAGISTLTEKTDFEILKEVGRKELLQESGISSAVLSGMVAKGYFELYEYETGRFIHSDYSVVPTHPLSPEQQAAYNDIQKIFIEKNVCLLHGVTSSGKTEIYIKLIQEQLDQEHQVLFLLPEIALTVQIMERLQKIFGDKLGIYHSGCTDNERVEIWNKQLSSNPFQIILGARSSIFLPFQRLGLVIVDEEHESSYKQQDPAPRYNARDSSIVLASISKAKVLLGSATPCMESYYNAHTGKYGYVFLGHRFGKTQLPDMEIVDTKDLTRRKLMPSPLSPRLQEEIRKALDAKEQIILFQNRRGYSPVLECRNCGWIPSCQRCDVSLTYHKNVNKLVCHYCGTVYDIPQKCPCCEENNIISSGFGTEKIEEEVHKLFPTARTARLDLDSTRTRHAYKNILFDFAQGSTDILIGTQMVSKGLDFDRVHVVGILDADTMLARPDFRAFERSFQTITQVSGRAGRRDKQGLVILQTKHPDYSVVQQIVSNDYVSMFQEQIEVRKEFIYPPFCRLIHIVLKHREDKTVGDAAMFLSSLLRNKLGGNILGPDRPIVSRVKLMYLRNIILKAVPSCSPINIRRILHEAAEQTTKIPRFHSVSIYFDVDPL